MHRTDAAYGLAVLLREIAKKVAVYSFSDNLVEVPARRGFALRDAIDASQRHNSTQLGNAVEKLNRNEKCARLIVITVEQAHDKVPAPSGKGYLVNVASYKNGVGYGKWDAHRWLERGSHRIHPCARADSVDQLKSCRSSSRRYPPAR